MKFFALISLLCWWQNVIAGDSPRSQNIDILVAMDTDSLLNVYNNGSSDPKKPKVIKHEYVYMITPSKNVVSNQASGELHVKANVGDTLRYFSLSETLNLETQVFVYRIYADKNDTISEPKVVSLENTPCVVIEDGDITKAFQSKCTNYYLSSVTKRAGTVSYRVLFALFVKDRELNKMVLQGYFEWDPKITLG